MSGAVLAAILFFLLAIPCGGGPVVPRLVRLAFVGDLMGHDVNYSMGDFRDIYRGVRDLLAADLAVANLEYPLDPARPPSSYPSFNGTAAYLRAAVEAGIGVFSLANNHIFDQAEEGVLQTIRSLSAAGFAVGRPVYWSGVRTNPAQPFAPALIDLDGLRVGFLAVTEFLNVAAGRSSVAIVDYHDRQAADAFVASVRFLAPSFDLFILSYHGDEEYRAEPEPAKMEFFARLIDSGATVIFAHHPHVLQAPRLVAIRGVRRLILPSMGNFISGMAGRLDAAGSGAVPGTGESAVARVEVICAGGVATVVGLQMVPIANYRNGRGEIVVARLADLAAAGSGLPQAWGAYYRRRLAEVEQLLGR